MTILKFKEDLMQLLPPGHSRPFVCNGSPLECEIFIIGINPATELDNPWQHWNDETGFDYNNWFEDYKNTRKEIGKRAVSSTRRNLNIISEALAEENIKVLETNLYNKPTARAKELSNMNKETDVLDFLIQHIQPKILLIHGNDVIKEFEKKIKKKITKDAFLQGNMNGILVNILPIQHLSYQFSKEKARAAAKELIQKVKDL